MTDLLFSAPFLAMVESLGAGARLQSGRRAARAGHVRQLTISSSLVVAQVRAPDEPVTHRARIAVRAFGAAEWARLVQVLAAEARYVADLLDGRMPDDVHAAFGRAGLSALPLSVSDIAMDCTCPGLPPCTHLAATCYAAASSFDSDPFTVFAWRGRGRDELLDGLREAVNAGAPEGRPDARSDPDDIAAFWGDSSDPERASASGRPGPVDALLDQADPPALTVAGAPLIDLLRPAYHAFSAHGARPVAG